MNASEAKKLFKKSKVFSKKATKEWLNSEISSAANSGKDGTTVWFGTQEELDFAIRSLAARGFEVCTNQNRSGSLALWVGWADD